MSEIIVLDTHIWLWLINANLDRFPAHWYEQIESASRVAISPISCYEIALAHEKGRIRPPTIAQEWFDSALESGGLWFMI